MPSAGQLPRPRLLSDPSRRTVPVVRRPPVDALTTGILEAALGLRSQGIAEAHGFLLAKELRSGTQARRLTAYGTLYKAIDRLERAGHLASRWEDPRLAADEGRPRRRFYRVTLTGETALAEAISAEREDTLPRSAAVQPS